MEILQSQVSAFNKCIENYIIIAFPVSLQNRLVRRSIDHYSGAVAYLGILFGGGFNKFG